MEWKGLYNSSNQPSVEEIADYIGGDTKVLWQSLMEYMETKYKAKPKLSYSVCAGKPGWNVKFQKSGQSFGTRLRFHCTEVYRILCFLYFSRFIQLT